MLHFPIKIPLEKETVALPIIVQVSLQVELCTATPGSICKVLRDV